MLSIEPLLGSLLDPSVHRAGGVVLLADQLQRNRIGWVITGGESHRDLSKVRRAPLDWFREIRDACVLAGVPFFHKQHGGGTSKTSKRGGALAELDGQLWHQMPEVWSAPAPGRRRPDFPVDTEVAPAYYVCRTRERPTMTTNRPTRRPAAETTEDTLVAKIRDLNRARNSCLAAAVLDLLEPRSSRRGQDPMRKAEALAALIADAEASLSAYRATR
jgi:hypothetical protein